jgi:hypothetical protein
MCILIVLIVYVCIYVCVYMCMCVCMCVCVSVPIWCANLPQNAHFFGQYVGSPVPGDAKAGTGDSQVPLFVPYNHYILHI